MGNGKRMMAFALVLSSCAALAAPRVAERANVLQLMVWNNASVPVELEVRADGKAAWREAVAANDIPSGISADAVLQLPTGNHLVEVIDHTRNLREAARLDVAEGGPNIGVQLVPRQRALVLSHQPLPPFTPGSRQTI